MVQPSVFSPFVGTAILMVASSIKNRGEGNTSCQTKGNGFLDSQKSAKDKLSNQSRGNFFLRLGFAYSS